MLKDLGARLKRPAEALRHRIWVSRARLGTRPEVAATLPEPVFYGEAERGQTLLAGHWTALGHEIAVAPGPIWAAVLPDARLEAERQACFWLDDLAALGNRTARGLAQAWVQDWIRRYGLGRGWEPELTGQRVLRWVAHSAMLTQGLDRATSERFWRALANQQRYLAKSWQSAEPGLPRLRALTGLVWADRVLPARAQTDALAALGELATEMVGPEGEAPSRAPEDLGETVVLLIWTARLLDDAGVQPAQAHLSAIVRAVPTLRQLRLGDGSLARFHGGGPGVPLRLDQALAELRLGAQPKPKLPMGFARLAGGRVVLIMDGAAPPAGEWASRAHAGALAFEMSIGRQPVVVNQGPGGAFGARAAAEARTTSAHSTVEIDGTSAARFRGGPPGRLEAGPTLVSVRQAQDATGMWLLATHDGYVASRGLLHERRIFVDARGLEARGEEILTVTDARARAQFDRAARRNASPTLAFALRFHLHPSIAAEIDGARQLVGLTLPSGETWVFRMAGGELEIAESLHLDAAVTVPQRSKQIVVRAEVVEYLGQITWSFGRVSEVPAVVRVASEV